MRERTLAWDGCLNVRDLGGHATEDGGETRWGSVIRADSVHSLTDAGWERLTAHGVATVLDLRSQGELAADPQRELELDVVHVPLVAEEGDPVWSEIREIGQRATGDVQVKSTFYLEVLRRWGPRFGAAVGAVAAARAGAVVVHCQVGKDRTGLVAALLLRLAGGSHADIAADYALSAPNLEERLRPWMAEAVDEAERERRVRQAASPAEAMENVLGALERDHGSIESYLRVHGLHDETIARARARLR